jgi:virginiamycin B lyase
MLAAWPAGAAKIDEFPIPTSASHPAGITPGPDGRLWFCENGADKIGAITTDGVITEYPIRASAGCNRIIAAGGFLWYTEATAGMVGAMTTTGSPVDGGSFTSPGGLANDANGRIWIANYGVYGSPGALYALQFRSNAPLGKSIALAPNEHPLFTTLGSDGYVYATWEIQGIGSGVVKCSPGLESCEGVATPNVNGPHGITSGPDGNIWFADRFLGTIGRITLYGPFAGSFTAFPTPSQGSGPESIVSGPDGALWFTETAGRIGRITTGGVATEYPIPTPSSSPDGIAVGPDGNIWFTESATNKIGRLHVHVPGDADGDGVPTVSDVFYLINFLFAGGPGPR